MVLGCFGSQFLRIDDVSYSDGSHTTYHNDGCNKKEKEEEEERTKMMGCITSFCPVGSPVWLFSGVTRGPLMNHHSFIFT